MKKILTMLTAAVLTTTVASNVVACAPHTTLDIIFVPSRPGVFVLSTAKALEKKLDEQLAKRGFNERVGVNISQNYNAAGQALQDDQVALAFLPQNAYVQFRGTKQDNGTYSDAGVLLTSSRPALNPDMEAVNNDPTLANKYGNSIADDITGHQQYMIQQLYNSKTIDPAHPITTQKDADSILHSKQYSVNYYRSLIYVQKAFMASEYNVHQTSEAWQHIVGSDGIMKWTNQQYSEAMWSDYNQVVSDVIMDLDQNNDLGHLLLAQDNTSSGGYIYPLDFIYETLRSNPHISEADAKRVVIDVINKHQVQSDYANGVQRLRDNNAKIAVGYADARTDINDNDTVGIYKNVEVLGVSHGISNDGIDFSRKYFAKKPNEINALRDSFKELIKDPANAWIFKIYAHTNYTGPESPDKATEWEAGLDKAYNDTNNNEALKNVMNWIKNN